MGVGSALRRLIGVETKGAPTGVTLTAEDGKLLRLWGRVLGFGPTAAGKLVTPDTAMQVSAFWACVKLLSETIATLPLTIYRREADGGRVAAPDHPLSTLLRVSPDGEHTAVEFWEGAVVSLCLHGDAFAEKIRVSGRLIALQPLRADLMSVRRGPTGRLVYDYSDPLGFRAIDEADVWHLRAFGNCGLRGMSPLLYARQTVAASIAADETANKLFANGVRPSGVLTMDQTLKKEQRDDVRENIVAPLAGSSNAGGVFVLEGGMKFSSISLSPVDSQLLESRRWHVEEIARWFGIPPILIGHASQGQTMWGTGVEQIALSWLTLGLRAQLRRIEAAISLRLIEPEERATIYAEFAVEGLLRADSESRAKLYASGAQNGWLTRNEIRQKENLNGKGPSADKLTVQSNLLPVEDLGKVAVMPREKPVEPGAAEQQDPPDEGKALPLVRLLPPPEPTPDPIGLAALDAHADTIKAFSTDQIRDAIGRWTSGGSGSTGSASKTPARESAADKAERETYHRDLLKVVGTGAAIVGAAAVAAMAGGPGVARIALVVGGLAEQFVVADAAALAIRHAAHREGYTPDKIMASFRALMDKSETKSAVAPSAAVKRIRDAIVEAVDVAADGLKARLEHARFTVEPADLDAAFNAVATVRERAIAHAEALTDDDLGPPAPSATAA